MIAALSLIAWPIVLWIIVATCYVAVIHLKKLRKQGKLHPFWAISLIVPGVIGWFIDVLFLNFVVGSVAYLERPRQLTFSSRIQRHYLDELASGKPRKFTTWFAARLNEIDDSPHIHGPR